MPAVHMHTEALAGRGKTWRWMSTRAGASGDRVLASSRIMYRCWHGIDRQRDRQTDRSVT